MNFQTYNPSKLDLSDESMMDFAVYMGNLRIFDGEAPMEIDHGYTCKLSTDTLQIVHSFLYKTVETEMLIMRVPTRALGART